MPPNMISRNACQEASVESNMAALAISCDTELTNFPFMQLAAGQSPSRTHIKRTMTANDCFGLPEIRLEIYSYLVVAYPSQFAPREDVTILVDCAWYEDQPKAVAIKRTGRHKGVFTSTCLAPQILRTCKAINREATPILYGENTFRFQPIKDEVFRYERFAKGILEALCRALSPNPVALWTQGAARIPAHATFAVLLRQIGQQNAASLKKLMFITREAYYKKSTQEAGQTIQMVTQLLKARTPRLRWVAICRGVDSWDKHEDAPMGSRGLSEIDEEEDGIPRIFRRKEQEAIHKAVADLVQEVTWLKQLSFAGFDKDVPAYEKMKEL